MRYLKRRQNLMMTALASLLMAGASGAQISALPDDEIENCLLEGTIRGKRGILIGVTRPVRFELDCSVSVDSAVFKHIESHRPGLTRLEGGQLAKDFSDSYKHERAAYLLDRELGLNMVPVAVLRKVRAKEGAMVAWIPNAGHESQMRSSRTGQQMAVLAPQKAIMRLFDALILNIDRRQENWLVDKDTWKLFLIDHSRAFQVRRQLPAEFTDQPARLTHSLYRQLEAMDETKVRSLLDDLISDSQIRALLARKELILEKIDRDRRELGSSFVFIDWQGDHPASEVASSDLGR